MRETLYSMSDTRRPTLVWSGLPLWVSTPTWWFIVMVTIGKAFAGSRSLLFLSRQDQGPVIHQPPRCTPFRRHERNMDATKAVVSLLRC